MDEYSTVIEALMKQCQFCCHLLCGSVTFATVFFVLLLVLCLFLVPLIESYFLKYHDAVSTGLEYLHGAIAWLCALTLYLLLTHLAKQKVRSL